MSDDIYARLRDTVVAALRGVVGDLTDDVTARVEVVSPHSLERSQGKAKRISDRRDR